MNYRLGKSLEINEEGLTDILVCPNCNNKVQFSVFSNMDTKIISKFPIIKKENIFFLICPKCASVFGVNTSNGENFKKGEKLSIGNYDFKELKKFNE